jgi:hypothetical protein
MSSRHWNTKLERLRLEQLVELTTFLIAKDTEDTSDDGDSSSSSCIADDALCVTVLYNQYINDVHEQTNKQTNNSNKQQSAKRAMVEQVPEATFTWFNNLHVECLFG